jgi:hypothetical protein
LTYARWSNTACSDGSIKSILLSVAEAEALVESFRRTRLVEGPRRSGAHDDRRTLAAACAPSLEALRNLRAAIEGEQYSFASAGILGDAICLFPQDDGVLLGWRARILEAVGIADEIDENWRIHLTVCRRRHEDTAYGVEEAMGKALPLRCEVRDLLIAHMHSDSQVTMQPL